MKIGEFIQQQKTTRDTVRHYMECGLLTPTKRQGNYWFTVAEQQAFENIIELKQMGFTLAMIQEVYRIHQEKCGTQDQWQHNLTLVQTELKKIEEEQLRLQQRQKKLADVERQLQERLATSVPLKE